MRIVQDTRRPQSPVFVQSVVQQPSGPRMQRAVEPFGQSRLLDFGGAPTLLDPSGLNQRAIRTLLSDFVEGVTGMLPPRWAIAELRHPGVLDAIWTFTAAALIRLLRLAAIAHESLTDDAKGAFVSAVQQRFFRDQHRLAARATVPGVVRLLTYAACLDYPELMSPIASQILRHKKHLPEDSPGPYWIAQFATVVAKHHRTPRLRRLVASVVSSALKRGDLDTASTKVFCRLLGRMERGNIGDARLRDRLSRLAACRINDGSLGEIDITDLRGLLDFARSAHPSLIEALRTEVPRVLERHPFDLSRTSLKLVRGFPLVVTLGVSRTVLAEWIAGDFDRCDFDAPPDHRHVASFLCGIADAELEDVGADLNSTISWSLRYLQNARTERDELKPKAAELIVRVLRYYRRPPPHDVLLRAREIIVEDRQQTNNAERAIGQQLSDLVGEDAVDAQFRIKDSRFVVDWVITRPSDGAKLAIEFYGVRYHRTARLPIRDDCVRRALAIPSRFPAPVVIWSDAFEAAGRKIPHEVLSTIHGFMNGDSACSWSTTT